MILSITAHRPNKFGGYIEPNRKNIVVRKILKWAIGKLDPEELIVGMAIGGDQWAARAGLDLNIRIIAAIPFRGQDRQWPEHSQKKYQSLLKEIISKGGEVKIINKTNTYRLYYFQTRNEWMVDNSNKLLAIWNGSKGGTSNTVEYARSIGKPVINIWDKIWNRWKELALLT